VREQRRNGAQVIKVCATGGVFSRNTEPGQQQLSEDELRAIAEEAHQWGLRVAAHAHGAAGIKAAIRAGIDTIEHASLVDAEGIRLARERGTYFSMDIFNTDFTQQFGAKYGIGPDNLRKDREIAQVQRDNFRAAHRAGVKMVFGSDAGVMPHGTAAGQFRYMVEYGMAPIDAIRAATGNAAEALGGRKMSVRSRWAALATWSRSKAIRFATCGCWRMCRWSSRVEHWPRTGAAMRRGRSRRNEGGSISRTGRTGAARRLLGGRRQRGRERRQHLGCRGRGPQHGNQRRRIVPDPGG
jgi:hypothetical protein